MTQTKTVGGGGSGPKAGPPRSLYEGAASTLCQGCGHDSVTRALITAFHEAEVPPHLVAKMSGIGCSSKAAAYFLGGSHGFNGVHGRMPAMAAGVGIANRTLKVVGVSGDGDTASIGMGQFCHAVRRNTAMLYVLANNGVYGLTKGQVSATADLGSVTRRGIPSRFPTIDCCAVAIEMGAGFVARAYAADQKQMAALFRAALAFPGFALVDVISPCVTFNPDHPGATKTYQWSRQNELRLNDLGFVPEGEPLPEIDPAEGETVLVELADGSTLTLTKLERTYDPARRDLALGRISQSHGEGRLLTGLLYLEQGRPVLAETLGLVERPLASLGGSELRPSRDALGEILAGLR